MSLWQLAVPHLQTSFGGLNLGVRAQPFLCMGNFLPAPSQILGNAELGAITAIIGTIWPFPTVLLFKPYYP